MSNDKIFELVRKLYHMVLCQIGVCQGDNLSPLIFAKNLHVLEHFYKINTSGLKLPSAIQNQNSLPMKMNNYINFFVLMLNQIYKTHCLQCLPRCDCFRQENIKSIPDRYFQASP